MFNKMDVDVIKTLLIPSLEVLANPEYQERVWVKNLDPHFSNNYLSFFEDFLLACEGILSAEEEYRLDQESRKAVKELYLEFQRFYSSWRFKVDGDIHDFIQHPEWTTIQQKAKALLEILRPIVAARSRNVVKTYLIPALEKLVDSSYQKETWGNFEGAETYDLWVMDFSEICEFLLSDKEEKIDLAYRYSLRELFTKVEEFDVEWGRKLADDLPSIIHHPDWIKIQRQAAEFLDLLKRTQQSEV